MSQNIWIIEGQLNELPEINPKRGRTHAIIRVEVDGGEIVMFARGELLLADVRKLKLGDIVRWTGATEPRDPQLRSNSPYFLNPDFLEKLN